MHFTSAWHFLLKWQLTSAKTEVSSGIHVRTEEVSSGIHVRSEKVSSGIHVRTEEVSSGIHVKTEEVSSGIHVRTEEVSSGIHVRTEEVSSGIHVRTEEVSSGIHVRTEEVSSGIHVRTEEVSSGIHVRTEEVAVLKEARTGAPRNAGWDDWLKLWHKLNDKLNKTKKQTIRLLTPTFVTIHVYVWWYDRHYVRLIQLELTILILSLCLQGSKMPYLLYAASKMNQLYKAADVTLTAHDLDSWLKVNIKPGHSSRTLQPFDSFQLPNLGNLDLFSYQVCV